MSDETLTPAQEEAQAHINAIYDPEHLHHAVAVAERDRWYQQRYPDKATEAPPAREGQSWSDGFAEKLAAKYPATISREGVAPGALSGPRVEIAAIRDELEKGRGNQPSFADRNC